MGFKEGKRNSREGFNMTITIQDENWRKVASFRWNSADKKKQNYIIKTLDDAYSIKLKPKTDIDWV